MSDHTPTCCTNFIGTLEASCVRCGDPLSEHQRLERIRDAAPDMYEALKAVIDDLERRAAMEGPDEPVAIGQSRYINAVAALRKAEEA